MHSFSRILIFALVLPIALASCQSAPSPVTESIDQVTSSDETLESTATSEVITVSQADLDQAPEEINECLLCHTNQQTLRVFASPEVVVESVNSGEG